MVLAIPAIPAPAAAAGPVPDVAPVLTSTPFAAPPGQRVTHTITVSGTGAGTLAAVRVTFTTTIDLDGVTANTTVGSCPIVTPLTIVCELGNLDFSGASPSDAAATPKVTIAGTVHAAAAPGTLVQNLVNVTSATPDGVPANNVASNAYLVPGGSAAPVGASAGPSAQPRSSSDRAAARGVSPLTAVAVLALAALAVGVFVVIWRRRSSSGKSSSGPSSSEPTPTGDESDDDV
ncbi:hypothetical protein Pfl04_50780 [Planosporangium flavigriseum]|uniref:DUF11 domain-containing protein n=2 Tax=Planosporangium flavigriseum TaxID=373681 RepID=A0A8J3LZM2_9ACTN|nr:hypothetical protein Pfl04_50780 [Planosporangium flavigriseum]